MQGMDVDAIFHPQEDGKFLLVKDPMKELRAAPYMRVHSCVPHCPGAWCLQLLRLYQIPEAQEQGAE